MQNMDTLALDNIDENFSPDLLALMGEWLTFTMIAPEMSLMQDEVLTKREFFEKGIIGANGAFTDNLIEYGPPNGRKSIYYESFLEAYGVTKKFYNGTPNYPHIKPIVRYDDLRQTFRENLHIEDKPIFPCFAFCSRGFLPVIEDIAFSCDAGCAPLIEAFCAEGYMAQTEKMFCWTPKVRPIMEILGMWKSVQELEREAREAEKEKKELAEDGIAYQRVFDECLSTESITPLIDYINEHNDLEQATLPIGEALTMLQNMDFWDVIGMFEADEDDFKPTNSNVAKNHKLIWCGNSV